MRAAVHWWVWAAILWAAPAAMAAPPAGTLEILGNDDFFPYEFVNPSGEPDGYNVELMRAVAREMGLQVRLRLEQWSDARAELESGRADALTGVMYSEERERFFSFSVPHVDVSYAVFVRKDAPFTSIDDLEGKEILVVKDVYAHDWMRQHPDKARPEVVDRPETALRRVSEGHGDAAVLVRLHGLDLMRMLGIENLRTVGPPVLSRKMGFAVRAGDRELLARLNEGLFRLQDSGEYDRIFLKWFSVEEQGRVWHQALGYARFALPALAVFLGVLALWIVSLNRTVSRKTRELQHNQALLNRIVQGTPVPVLVTDAVGRVVHCNAACTRLTGSSIAASRPVPASTGTPSAYRSRFLARLEAQAPAGGRIRVVHSAVRPLRNGETVRTMEVFVPWLGKRGKWLSGVLAPFVDGSGGSAGAIETWQDVTERKALQRRLEKARKLEAMGGLAGRVAHDFGGYLQALGASTEMARIEARKDAAVLAHIEDMEEALRRARQLTRQIQIFSRRGLEEPEPVAIRDVVEKAVGLMATSLGGATLRCELNSEERVMANESQLHQVVFNLCRNAVQALGGRDGVVSVKLDTETDAAGRARQRQWVCLTVSDTGAGIPADVMGRIFEPFFTTRGSAGGSGMGLAIVHGIVKGYGGRIRVHSKTGQGTVFQVRFPAAPQDREKKDPAPLATDRLPSREPS